MTALIMAAKETSSKEHLGKQATSGVIRQLSSHAKMVFATMLQRSADNAVSKKQLQPFGLQSPPPLVRLHCILPLFGLTASLKYS